MSEKTVFQLMYRSVRATDFCDSVPERNSANARLSAPKRFLRIRKRVYAAPTSIPPTAIGRTHARSRIFRHASRLTRRGVRTRSEPDPAAETAYRHEAIEVHGKKSQRPEEVDDRTEPHVVEEILGRLASPLPRLVDLSRGHRLGKRQRGIFDHDTPYERHEKHTEDAADEHKRRRLPVGIAGLERRPYAGDNECRQRENRAGGNRFSDRTCRT